MKTQAGDDLRQAWGAGRWFPGGGPALRAAVDGYLGQAQVPPVKGRIVAALAPHAGYPYSGPVAGHTFRALRENRGGTAAPQVVVVLGFCHRASYEGVALLGGSALSTPLGHAILDREAVGVLTNASRRVVLQDRPHQGEHSAENEVPFVQAVFPGVPLVVALMGDHSEATVDELVKALLALQAKKDCLVIGSTDLLHDADYDLVTRTDKATLELVRRMDTAGLAKAWSPDRQVCCGIGPVLCAMRFAAARGCREALVLRYRNSGDDHPESRGDWVVGYGAVAFPVADSP